MASPSPRPTPPPVAVINLSPSLRGGVTPYFLRREERSKEASTPSKSSPIWEDLTQKIAETDDFLPFWYRGTRDVFFSATAQSEPLCKGRRQQGCRKLWLTPMGRKLESHTKTLMEGGLCPESTTSLPYREGLGLGGCLFASFSAPEKVRKMGLGVSPKII